MFPLISLVSLLPEGSQALAAGLHPEILRAWILSLSRVPPEEAATALKDLLKRISIATSYRARLKMLDIMAEETQRIVCIFESELDGTSHPLSTALQRKVVIGNDLLKQHAKCYRSAAERLVAGWIRRGNAKQLQRALAGAMEMERRRLILAYRAYASGSKSAWRNLHKLYSIAKTSGIAASSSAGGVDSLHNLYIKTLLLAHAEPVQMVPGDLDRVRFYLDRYGGLAALLELRRPLEGHDAGEGCFLIRQKEEGPGRSLQKWHNIELQSGDMLLDCGPLLKEMRFQIDALTHGALPSKIGLPAVARRPQYLAMMNNLLTLWSAPPTRRSQRQHFKPRVELAVGLDDLWSLLSGATLMRRRDDRTEPSVTTHSIELSEWSVMNESPTGFALQYLNGESSELSVGAIVGARSLDRTKAHICFVRRLVSGEHRRAELGLEKYAPFAVPTMIFWGGSNAENKSPSRAIVLPKVPSLEGKAAVIVAPNTLGSGKRVPFVLDGQKLTYISGVPIERSSTYEIFEISNPDETPVRSALDRARIRREKVVDDGRAQDAE